MLTHLGIAADVNNKPFFISVESRWPPCTRLVCRERCVTNAVMIVGVSLEDYYGSLVLMFKETSG